MLQGARKAGGGDDGARRCLCRPPMKLDAAAAAGTSALSLVAGGRPGGRKQNANAKKNKMSETTKRREDSGLCVEGAEKATPRTYGTRVCAEPECVEPKVRGTKRAILWACGLRILFHCCSLSRRRRVKSCVSIQQSVALELPFYRLDICAHQNMVVCFGDSG